MYLLFGQSVFSRLLDCLTAIADSTYQLSVVDKPGRCVQLRHPEHLPDIAGSATEQHIAFANVADKRLECGDRRAFQQADIAQVDDAGAVPGRVAQALAECDTSQRIFIDGTAQEDQR